MAAPVSCVACRELPEEGILFRHLFFSPSVDLAEAIDLFRAGAPGLDDDGGIIDVDDVASLDDVFGRVLSHPIFFPAGYPVPPVPACAAPVHCCRPVAVGWRSDGVFTMASGSPASKKRRPLEPRERIRDSMHEPVDTAACTGLLVPHIFPSTSLQQFVEDGEYIFPGGLQESRHSVLSDINSVIGEYLVICSTPHVPQKGNPSAPPDYANHDAIQIPQQCQHPNPPTQQPPAVRPGGVTKNESLDGGVDDNLPPHCSAMGGATNMPHIKTTYGEEEDEEEDNERERHRKTAHKRAVSFACLKKVDEKDETVNLRPLKKIESAEGRTIVYEPSNPKDIERWSAEIDHPRRAGLQPWMQLKQLMHLYELHPNDGLAILFKHLSSTERTQIRYDVEDAIGEDGMRPEKGWDNNTDLDSLDLPCKLIDTG
ncbi:unnamed protein product [Boreogadus saida]